MTISMQNRHLLERMTGQRLPVGNANIKLSLEALGKILDAARAESAANGRSLFEEIFGRTA